MAEQQQAIELSATFPDPPPFWRDFTPEKIEQLEELKSRYADQIGLDVSAIVRVPDVPEDLINLQPPPEPAVRKWRLFDEQIPLSVCLGDVPYSL
jgi:mediator of RNA polymerase II transcription subunit 7